MVQARASRWIRTGPIVSDSNRNAFLRRLPLIAVIVVASLGFWFLRDILSFEALRANHAALTQFRDQNYLLSVAGFIVLYIVIVGFSLPGATVATLTGGFLFGVFPGVLFNLIGATVGAIAIFLAARAGLGERLAARIDASEGNIRRIKEGIDSNQWSMLFLMRLVPAVPFFVANLIPALLDVPLHRYAVTTFLGIMPGTLVLTSVGAGLGEVFDAGTVPDFGILLSPAFLLPVIGLCVLAALPIVVRVLRARKGI
jgi:uncharacterized membrane protein YdjX (TVP38/TMEM64 family)